MSETYAINELKRIQKERDFDQVFLKINEFTQKYGKNLGVVIEIANTFLLIKKPDLAAKRYAYVNNELVKQKKSLDKKSLVNWARSLIMAKDNENAVKLLGKLVKSFDKDPEILGLLSRFHRLNGDLENEEKYAELAFSADERDFEASLAKAFVLDRTGSSEDAIKILYKNIDSDPPHGDSIDKWLEILKRTEQFRYASEKLSELTKKFPKNLEFVYGLAVVHNNLGELDKARKFYLRAIKLAPSNPRIIYELGVMEKIAGNLTKASEYIEKALEMQPDNIAAVRTFGQEHKYVAGDFASDRLFLVASRMSDMNNFEQAHAHYALAKYFEDIKQVKTAFRHYAYAGQKKNEDEPFSIESARKFSNLTTKYVNKELIRQTGEIGYESELPVFILGMPRSGTSLMEQVLSSHEQIFGAGELKFMGPVLENIKIGVDGRILLGAKEPVFKYEEHATYEQRGKAFVEYLKGLAGSEKYTRIVDKMPGNFNHLGLIRTILPGAKIIHSRRHPVETCLSNYRINFAEGQLWSYNLKNLGQYYRIYWETMKYWRKEFAGEFLEVRYEDNVIDLEASSKRIMEYIGLDWTPDLLDFHKNDRAVKTASITQVRRPIYTSSMNRWKKYEEFLGPLLFEIEDIIEEYEAESPEIFK